MYVPGSIASKFARRVGYGLKPNEVPPQDLVGWAVKQINNIPRLSIPLPDGSDLLEDEKFVNTPDYAPIENMSDAVELWGQLHNRWLDINELAGKMSPSEWQQLMYEDVYFRRADIVQWRDCLVRASTAAHGQGGVFEKFWTFWVNHFAVHARHFTKLFYGPYTRIVREHMLGSFSDLAREAILNPAMLEYLDNIYSSGPDSLMVVREWDRGATINENLGREVLELHTVGVESGYSQKDVTEMAYALTGWGIYSGKKDEFERLAIRGQPFGTYFEPRRHQPGSREISGISIPEYGNGMSQAPIAIDHLARRPEMVARLSRKLAEYFIADNPPDSCVAAIQKTWFETDGHLPAVHKTVIEQCFQHIESTTKIATSEEWLFSLYRTTGAPLPTAVPGQSGLVINHICSELGQPYDEVPQPDGWSCKEADWLSSTLLERKFRFAHLFADRSSFSEDIIKQNILRDFPENNDLGSDTLSIIAEIEGRNASLARLRSDLVMTYACSPHFMYS